MTNAPPATTPASDRQVGWLESLLAERGRLHRNPAGMPLEAEGGRPLVELSKAAASRLIDELLATPRAAKPKAAPRARPDVPEGRYALPNAAGDDVVFYGVDRPTRGRWAGYTFLKQLVGAPGAFDERRVPREREASVLAAIAADPAAAALRFSRHFTVCSRCLSPLSQVRSRATGFGSTCAGHLGVTYLDRATALRVLREQGISLDGLEDLGEEG
jgi:hypothetical protein